VNTLDQHALVRCGAARRVERGVTLVISAVVGLSCGLLLDPAVVVVLSVAEMILFVWLCRLSRDDGPTARQVRR
jgi:hypothetical protein